jgi:heme oxygenase
VEGAALSALREATEASQRALEQTALWRRVMSCEVTLDDYRAWLQAHLAVSVCWAEACPLTLRRRTRCDPNARVDALHLDLAVLGDSVLREAPANPCGFDWPDASAAWSGALYVFEGSRLDARVVARHLRQQLGFCVAGALRFLDPVNEATSQPAWSSIVQELERSLSSTDALREAIAGALATLECLRQVLSADPAAPDARHGAAAA